MQKLDLKSFLTIAITLSMIGFTAFGLISPELFISVSGSIFTYYFSRQDKNKNEKKPS